MNSEERYLELQCKRKLLDIAIKDQKKVVHKDYMTEHRKLIRTLDIILVVALLFNLGAMAMTNALVYRTEPAKELHELNPFQCGLQGFDCATVNTTAGIEVPDYAAYFGIVSHIMLLGIMVAVYWICRYKISTTAELYSLMFFVMVMLIVCCFDFTNDVGFWIGKMLFGV